MTATILDAGIALVIILSLSIGFIRGLVREFISLATWVAAFGFALLYAKTLSQQLPFVLQSDIARLGMAFAVIFFSVLVIGAIINYLLSAAVSSIGLGGINRFLGAVFGAARGVLIVILLMILMGVTTFPAQSWWVESQFIPYFEQGADWLKQQVPEDLSRYLDSSQVP